MSNQMMEADEDETPYSESQVATMGELPLSEMQAKLARDNPRNEVKVLDGCLAEIKMNPHLAEEMYYSIPYKDKEGEGGSNIAMVEGLSIVAAMMVARRWGNCANGARVADDREDRVMTQGMFFDYETNVLTLRDKSVSKFYKPKGRPNSVRMKQHRIELAIGAGESKAVRNAILATVPTYLREAVFKQAKWLVLNPPVREGEVAKTIKERIEAGKLHFIEKLKATKEEVEALIGSWIADSDGKIGEDQILSNLIGLKNAIKDGQIGIDAAMGREKAAPSMPQEKAPDTSSSAAVAPAAVAEPKK